MKLVVFTIIIVIDVAIIIGCIVAGHHYYKLRFLRSVAMGTAVILCLVFVVVPVLCHLLPSLLRFFLFLNKIGDNVDFNEPEDLGLPGTRNFYLETDKDVEIGVWHILPESLVHSVPENTEDQEKWFEGSLSSNQPIILYMHGNKGSRAQDRRIVLYNLLRRMGYHIIAMDYRGYADSSSVVPSETGLVTDVKILFEYVTKQAKPSLVYVWGHSLGTGVACHSASELCQEGNCPGGVILESPFNNIEEEVRCNPLTVLFRWLPYFDWAFIEPIREMDAEFKSDEHIRHITVPIIILHAKDDKIIPFKLGKKLLAAAQKGRLPELPPVKFVEFEAKYGYGHNHIARAPELPTVISNFINNAQLRTSLGKGH